MTKNVYRMAGLAVVAGLAIALTACTCPCPQTVKKGTLTQSVTPVMALSSTNQSQGSFISSAGGTNCCSSCGYIPFYTAWPLTGGVEATVPLSRSSTMYPLVDPSTYCVWYRYGGLPTQTGCFTGSSFTPPVTGTYFFTVYIRTACPANGTQYYQNVFLGR